MLPNSNIVDIVSPGTACSKSQLKEIKDYLKKVGLTPRIFSEDETSLTKKPNHNFASIAAEKRFQQLKKSIESKDSKLIWCVCGGYGSAEILPFLQKMKKPKEPKVLIGFSDISALSIFLIQEWKWQVISAPMLLQIILHTVSSKAERAIVDLIFGKTKELKYALKPLTTKAPKKISGEVTGGCISVLMNHFATKNQLDWHNKILFLEDEGEDGERLDRYFHQIVTIIKESGKKPRAIVLGNFLQANPFGTPKAKNIEIALKRFAEKLDGITPVFSEKTKCLGHSKDMMPLILGGEAEIGLDEVLRQKTNTSF